MFTRLHSAWVTPYRASITLLSALFLFVLYRAKFQSFVIDEAWTFFLYFDTGINQMVLDFYACNHVLHTLLTKFFRYWLGYSELVLRLGSLVGCALWFVAVLRTSRLLFGNSWIQTLSVAVLTLNPLVLDFSVAARGYGLALGLFWFVLYYVLRIGLGEAPGRLLWRAGVGAGLCLAANLTFLVPLLALSAALAIVSVKRGLWRQLDLYAGPATVVAFVFLALPLARAKREHFYVGVNTWREVIETLFDFSMTRLGGQQYLGSMRITGTMAIFYLVGAAGLLAFVWWLVRGERDSRVFAFGLVSFVLAASVAVLTLLKHVVGMLYPFSRTGLYLIPLYTFMLVLSFHFLSRYGRVQSLGNAVLAALVLIYIVQVDPRYFAEWKFDAGTSTLAHQLASDHMKRPTPSRVSIGATRLLEQSLNFYKKRRRMNWIGSIQTDNLESRPFDYYVLVEQDTLLVEKLHLKVLYKDSLSGAVLAVPS